MNPDSVRGAIRAVDFLFSSIDLAPFCRLSQNGRFISFYIL